MSAIRDLYQKIPDGGCAFIIQRGDHWQPNLEGCPRMKNDVCARPSRFWLAIVTLLACFTR